MDSDTNCNWCTWNYPKGLVRRLEELEIQYQNIEKSPGDFRIFAVSENLFEDHQLMQL